MREIVIDTARSGTRLDRVLEQYLNGAGSGFIYKMLRKKNIVVNGEKADGGRRLETGDVIRLYLAEETISTFQTKGLPTEGMLSDCEEAYHTLRGDDGDEITIVYEDDNVILLNKPPGILSQKRSADSISLNEWLRGYLLEKGASSQDSLALFRPSAANRLDRGTSGLITCVKTAQAARMYTVLQKEGALQKCYHAIVYGVVKKEGVVHSTVRISPRLINKMEVVPAPEIDKNRISLTYHPIDSNPKTKMSLIEVHLYEGKKHQIRAQLAERGFPVAGDFKYGDRDKNETLRVKCGVRTQLLHSYALTFPPEKDWKSARDAHALNEVYGKTFRADYHAGFRATLKFAQLSAKKKK